MTECTWVSNIRGQQHMHVIAGHLLKGQSADVDTPMSIHGQRAGLPQETFTAQNCLNHHKSLN